MRSSLFALFAALVAFAFAQRVPDLPPHSISPTPSSSQLFRRGSATLDSAASSLESSVMSLANSATKAVKGQGVCASNSTCAGFIHFAQTCSEKGDAAAIAGCICSATSLEVMNACTNCISSNSVKANANHFSSFCNSASSTLALLAASASASASSPTSVAPSSIPHDQQHHSGAGRRTESASALLIVFGVVVGTALVGAPV
ncbi:hypothetical protein JCM11491_003253 [Sporobolomyces phaffii]